MEGGRDLARRDLNGLDPHLLHDLRAETEEAHLHTLQIVDRPDLLPEPSGSLGRNEPAGDVVHALRVEHPARHLEPAALIHPREVLPHSRPERDTRKEVEGAVVLAEPPGTGPCCVDLAFGDRICRLCAWHQFAGLVEGDFDLSTRRSLHLLREAECGVAEDRHASGKCACKIECHQRRRECKCRAHAESDDGQKANDERTHDKNSPNTRHKCGRWSLNKHCARAATFQLSSFK